MQAGSLYTSQIIHTAGELILQALLVIISASAYTLFIQKKFIGVQLAESLKRFSEREEEAKITYAQVLTLSSENAGLQQELRIRIRDGEDLSGRITELQAESRKNVRELERMRSKVKEGSALSLRAQAERAAETAELKSILDATRAGCAQRDHEIQTKTAEALASTKENGELRKQILELKQKNTEFEDRVCGMSNESQKREEMLEAARSRNKEMHECNISHSSNLSKKAQEIAKLRADLKALTDECSLRDMQIRAKDARIGDLSSENKELKKQVLDLEQGCEALASHVAAAIVEAEMRGVELETVRAREKEEKGRNMLLSVSLATREAEISQLETRLEVADDKSRSKDDQLQVLKRTVKGLKDEVLILTDKFEASLRCLNNDTGTGDIDDSTKLKSIDWHDRSCIDEDATERYGRSYFSEPEPKISYRPSFYGTRGLSLVKGNNHCLPPESEDRSHQ